MTEPATETELSVTQLTASQMFDDLGGFEEIAVAQRFGDDISKMSIDAPTKFIRALVFVDLRRHGASDGDAFKKAQAMKLGKVMAYFADEPDDTQDDAQDDAGDEAGKES